MSDKFEDLKSEAMTEMHGAGYLPTDLIIDDDFHRFGTKGSQWYVAHYFETTLAIEPILLVSYGDWRSGEKFKFQTKKVILSPEDRLHLQEQLKKSEEKAEQVRKEMQDEAAIEYQSKWETLSVTGTSPYLDRKQISDCFGTRYQDDNLYLACCYPQS